MEALWEAWGLLQESAYARGGGREIEGDAVLLFDMPGSPWSLGFPTIPFTHSGTGSVPFDAFENGLDGAKADVSCSGVHPFENGLDGAKPAGLRSSASMSLRF